MSAPVMRDAAVIFVGERIVAVGDAAKLRREHPDAKIEDLGDSILLPGLVNPHTHLELSYIRRGEKPAGFVEWILELMSQTARTGAASSDAVRDSVRSGVEQCLKFGVTSVGDISKQCMHSRPALEDGPLRVVSYGEIQAMAQRRALLEERFVAAADVSHDSKYLTTGLTPHAPYTVEPEGYAKCLEFCRAHRRPLATHLAENPEEAIFLSDHSGPFRHLWEAGVNAWDDAVPKHEGGPIRFAQKVGLLDFPTLLAHVNYCDDDEMSILARGRASVVFCPRTHAFFGHPLHRWREMLARGINVAVGTDSCASSPDLNLVDELRLLHNIAPEVPLQNLWEMATIRAARAIQNEHVGQLAPGALADIVAFPATGSDPLRHILESNVLPTEVWIGGTTCSSAPPSRG